LESIMIDHVGFSVSDYGRAKAFYEKALAPLGYALIMEVTAQETGQPAAGFGSDGKPDFWIGGEGRLEKPVHVAIVATTRPAVDAFYQAARAAGGRDHGPPGLRPHYHPNYDAAFVLDPDGHNIEAVSRAGLRRPGAAIRDMMFGRRGRDARRERPANQRRHS
jgi:catechol 2,3-dioxygenase-like lactoylglutathione lyase family enzyme